MIRKSFLQNLGGYDEQYRCQDGYELWVKFVRKYKVTNVNTPLFYYRQHGNNLTTNEEKILSTRISIKDNYLSKLDNEKPTAIAVIPLRSKNNDIVFQNIGGESLIDRKIREAAKIRNICKVIVTSSDPKIGEYVSEKYNENREKIIFCERPEIFERLNVGLEKTISFILNLPEIKQLIPTIIATISIEFPFISAPIIEDAINTLELFNSDSLISVRPVNNVIYQHDGGGMKAILNQEKFTKLEREILYLYTGGIIITRTRIFKEFDKLIGGRVGHVTISQKAALGISSKLDIEIANSLSLINYECCK